jgi:hypothetical protein
MAASPWFILARLAMAGLLFWDAASMSLRHYVAFRLAVSAVGVWGCWRAFEGEDWPLDLFFFVLVVGPHLFYASEHAPMTWAVVGVSTGILLLLSIVLVDSGPLEMLFAKPSWTRLRALVTIVFGVAWMAFGVSLAFGAVQSIASAVLIALDGGEAEARVTRVTHWVESNDNQYYDVYETEYVFRTEDGRAADGVARLFENPVDGLSGSEFDEKYGGEYLADDANPVVLKVEYQRGDPANNRVPSIAGTASTLLGALMKAAIGACCAVLGFFLCTEDGFRRLKRA